MEGLLGILKGIMFSNADIREKRERIQAFLIKLIISLHYQLGQLPAKEFDGLLKHTEILKKISDAELPVDIEALERRRSRLGKLEFLRVRVAQNVDLDQEIDYETILWEWDHELTNAQKEVYMPKLR